MSYVYVVTVSPRGASRGEFSGTPTAFEEQTAAEAAAFACRERIGGRFALVQVAGADTYIVERWDGGEFSVWVERLIFRAALRKIAL